MLQPRGVPESGRHAPRRDRDRGLDPPIHALEVVGVRLATLGEHPVRRRSLERLTRPAVPGADDIHDAVAPHRISDDAGALGVHQSGEKAAWRVAQARDFGDGEELVERAVVERAREALLVVIGAVLVIDRDDDEAFAGEVFTGWLRRYRLPG